MPFTLTMPKLSPTMEEGTIAKWHKQEGDKVKAGDLLFEVATDKATVEYNALDDGYLRKILIPSGKEAAVGVPVAIFTEQASESIEGYQPQAIRQEVLPGEAAAVATPVAAEAPAAAAAPRSRGTSVGAMPAFVPEEPLTGYTFPTPSVHEGRVFASPLARRLAQEKHIDIASVPGSGPHGRVMSRDLDQGAPAAAVGFASGEVPSTPPGSYEEETLSPMRKVIAQRLQDAKTWIPHFYVSQEVCVDSLEKIREELKGAGLKLSVNDFIVRAAALALREHPHVNSGFHSVNGTLIRFHTIDIAIAVSVEAGLITPIVRHADYKTLGQISTEIRALAQKARQGKLAREEYSGGSFTISNLGMFGVDQFVAIINPPQAAILAVGGIEERPIVREGQIVVGKIMNLTLSADHRVIDGADAAKFLQTLKEYLQNPSRLLLHAN